MNNGSCNDTHMKQLMTVGPNIKCSWLEPFGNPQDVKAGPQKVQECHDNQTHEVRVVGLLEAFNYHKMNGRNYPVQTKRDKDGESKDTIARHTKLLFVADEQTADAKNNQSANMEVSGYLDTVEGVVICRDAGASDEERYAGVIEFACDFVDVF